MSPLELFFFFFFLTHFTVLLFAHPVDMMLDLSDALVATSLRGDKPVLTLGDLQKRSRFIDEVLFDKLEKEGGITRQHLLHSKLRTV